MRARRTVISRVEHAAKGGTHAEHIEIVAADEVAADALRAASPDDRHGGRESREKASEHVVAVAEVRVHRIRECHPIERAALKRSRTIEKHQLRRRVYRQAPQQHLIHQGKDRRVGPHAEAEGEDDDERKAEVLAQAARRVSDFSSDAHEWTPDRRLPTVLRSS